MEVIICCIFVIILVAWSHYVNSPEGKGRVSEGHIARKLENDFWRKNCGGRVLRNLYIPREDGKTAEIDVLCITKKGLLVVEDKNYAGYIFGNDRNPKWTVTLYAGKTWYGGNKVEKHHFYNPVWQNRTHIKNLKLYLERDIKCFSLITFSERGEIKNISIKENNTYVCQHNQAKLIVNQIWDKNEDILSETEINEIYNMMLPLANASEEIKKKHIDDIQRKFAQTDMCPICGGKLVQRTAKRGVHEGENFLGCSNYPKCKYIKKLIQ